MALTLKDPDDSELQARITVFGVGGAGGNAVNNMIDKNLEGVEFIAANTDAQALSHSRAPRKIQLGTGVTRGLGAGSKPDVGLSAAEESLEEIAQALEGSHMCFITAGMGGGTGTGAAPVVARIAREMGILTVGVVTKPFQFEGTRRMALAEKGVSEMQLYVDTLIVIPNQNLFQVASERTTFVEAFQMADDVLYQGVQGVTDLMVRPGMINLDFADVRSVMEEMGKAMMGTGEASGDTRAIDAAEKAIANPLLDEISLKGAKGVLINITGGYDLTLFEMDEAANRIKDEVDPNALIKFGSSIDPEMEGKMRVSVVATGIDAESMAARIPMDAPRRRPVTTDPGMISAVRGRARAEAPSPQTTAASRTAEAVARVQAALPLHTAAHAQPAPAPQPAPQPAPAPVQAAAAPAPQPQPAPVAAAPMPAPVPEPKPQPSYEQRLATAPSPADIRARAEEVRQRALEARARREAERLEMEIPIHDPALFELDEASIDPGSLRADPAPRREAPRSPDQDRMREPQSSRAAARPDEPGPSTARSGLFAINKLINRVAGGTTVDQRLDRVSGTAPRADGDDDDGDIPAFLRRQAN